MNPLKENLIKCGDNLVTASNQYIEWSEKLQEAEEKYKTVRATAMESETVAGLPNQAMREARLDVVLQNDERFSSLYMAYLMAKLEQKKAWIMFDLAKELNENARALLNNSTYGKEVKE